MAKKSKKKTAKKQPARYRATNGSGKHLARKAKKSPRSQTLPGMEQVRSRKLDNLCEAINDARSTMNAAKADETGSIQSALQVMVRDGVTVYKHGGVELARVPGAEKLRVRLVKEQGDADASDLEPADETTETEPGAAEAFDNDADGLELN